MAGITWYPRKFADAVERSHRNKQLLIISVTYSQVNQTEDTILQDTLLNSFDFGDCKVLAVRVELDSVGSNMKVFSESFPDVDSPGIIFVGLNDKAEPKVYDKLPSLCDLSESATPILEEYKANYIKFREANPDFTSDHEEIEPVEELSLEEKKKSVKEAIAKAKAKKAKEEEEEQLRREIQRIKDGKNALDMQEKIKEVNQRREIEKQRMEKEADQKRLRELRELERRDKEERARRKAEAQGTAQPASSTPAPSTVETKPQPIASDDCRICYQFPDGTRVMKVFKSSVNFREVFDAIKDDPHIQGSYKLFTTFPRKAIEEYNKNLIELCLTPASVLAVVKIEEMQVVNQGVGYLKNAAMMAFTLVCGPLASLFQFFSLLFGFRVENPTEPSESDKQPKRQQRRSREEKKFKKDGKIQGLNDDDSKSSDEEGTWNGNSTQQL
jgi:hypothetical protein